jgi:LacI family transcriptional regulator, gluconate utilization system Gnt-I transcriptional repressor
MSELEFPDGRTRVRIQDVAHHAGVSAMTVSRALRQPEKVSESLRQRVAEAVDRVGYLPSRIAASLSSNRSNVVGLILPSLRNSLFADTIQGISDVLHRAGHHLMIADSGYGLAEEEAAIRAFLQQRVCGLLLHNTWHTDSARRLIRQVRVPVVEIGDLTPEPIDITVSYSNFEAARSMTTLLARRGYRHIGFVTLPLQDNVRSVERRRGYLASLAECGLEADPKLVLEMPGGVGSGAEAIGRLSEANPNLDAVFFAGDVLAVGAILECQRRGWAVPGRIAIARFDDVDLLSYANPPVTTVRIPRYDNGRRSAKALLDRLSERAPEPVRLDLEFQIIERGST